jgi:hypothetical protein
MFLSEKDDFDDKGRLLPKPLNTVFLNYMPFCRSVLNETPMTSGSPLFQGKAPLSLPATPYKTVFVFFFPLGLSALFR